MATLADFGVVAAVVTLTPGPATATIVRMAARHGRRTAFGATLGNSVGVLVWGLFSALGVSTLIVASQLAYDALRLAGAVVLVVLGLRSLLAGVASADEPADGVAPARGAPGLRTGLITSLSNPKLAVFFIALFPQFLSPGSAVLPRAMTMACAIVALDLIWYSALAYGVDRARVLLRPRLQRRLERVAGGVLIAVGVRLALATR